MVGERAMELDENDDAMPGNIPHFPGDPNTELDLPPEYCHYRDEGCDLAESCLNCPFARCVYDEPGGISPRMPKPTCSTCFRGVG
ncbi:hypothetical protein ACFLVU_02510 [Chloroflexota bacterium]